MSAYSNGHSQAGWPTLHAPILLLFLPSIAGKQALLFSMIACWRNQATFFAIQTLGELPLSVGLLPGTMMLKLINLAIAAILYASV